jgi:hypothetical protein
VGLPYFALEAVADRLGEGAIIRGDLRDELSVPVLEMAGTSLLPASSQAAVLLALGVLQLQRRTVANTTNAGLMRLNVMDLPPRLRMQGPAGVGRPPTTRRAAVHRSGHRSIKGRRLDDSTGTAGPGVRDPRSVSGPAPCKSQVFRKHVGRRRPAGERHVYRRLDAVRTGTTSSGTR